MLSTISGTQPHAALGTHRCLGVGARANVLALPIRSLHLTLTATIRIVGLNEAVFRGFCVIITHIVSVSICALTHLRVRVCVCLSSCERTRACVAARVTSTHTARAVDLAHAHVFRPQSYGLSAPGGGTHSVSSSGHSPSLGSASSEL